MFSKGDAIQAVKRRVLSFAYITAFINMPFYMIYCGIKTLNMDLKILTGLSFSAGSSNTHLSFESMSSSGFASFHWNNLILNVLI